MQTTFAIISILTGLLAALAGLFPWHQVISDFQARQNESHRRSLIGIIEKQRRKVYDQVTRYPIKSNFNLVGTLYGLFAAYRASARLSDFLHNALRKRYGLHPYSLQEPEGMINPERVHSSFDELADEIRQEKLDAEPRDLRWLALWLSCASAVSAIIALFF